MTSRDAAAGPVAKNPMCTFRKLCSCALLWLGLSVVLMTPALAGCDSHDPAGGEDEVPDRPGWKLVWNDEFSEDGLPAATRWTYDVGNHGFGNNELQTYYADEEETARVEDGHLVITASLVERGDAYKEYRSARLKTKGLGDWRYGRIEVRAKLPAGRGTWPAIWMLPTENSYGGWPRSGEIDIMEHVGYDPTVVHGTVHTEAFNHTKGTQQGNQIKVDNALTDFNVYAVEWSADRIDFFVNDEPYFTFENTGNGPAEWPFDQPFHLILNIAVGGNWGGQRGVDDTIFPQQMVVDYVRVYEQE